MKLTFKTLASVAIFAFLVGFAATIAIEPPRAPAQLATAEPAPAYTAQRIQMLLDAGEHVELPAGTIDVASTIVISRKAGNRIRGQGAGALWPSPAYGERSTWLRWTGKANGTMFRFEGSASQKIEGVTLDGNRTAGTLVKIVSLPGFGAGSQRWDDVRFVNATNGIECGELEGDANCDAQILRQVIFQNLSTGFRTLNHQSVYHHFYDLTAKNVGTVIDAARGGNVIVDGADAAGVDWFLRVGYGGPNANLFSINNARFELCGSVSRHAHWVDARPVDSCQVILSSCQDTEAPLDGTKADNSAEPLFVVGRGATVQTIHHVHGARPVAAVLDGAYRDSQSRWVYRAPDRPDNWKTTGGSIRVTDAQDNAARSIGGFEK